MSIRQFHFYLGVTVRRGSNWNAWHVIESIRAFPAKVRPVIHLAHIIFTGPVFMYAPMLLSARGHDTSCDSQSVNSPTSQPASQQIITKERFRLCDVMCCKYEILMAAGVAPHLHAMWYDVAGQTQNRNNKSNRTWRANVRRDRTETCRGEPGSFALVQCETDECTEGWMNE